MRANDGLRVDESAPRRLLRCWTLALAAALLALAGAAQAQDQTVVENLAQGGNQVLELNRVAQTFETGPNTGGYTVTHVTLRANAAPHPAGTSSTVRAMLCNVDSSGKPPDNLGFCTWTGTVRFFDAGDLDFELERAVRLLPNKKYAIVADRTAGALPPLSATASGSADSASSAGWDIGAGGLPWQWAMTRRQNGTFHERWERVPWARYLRFGLYGRFNLLNEPNRGNPPVFRDDDGLVELTIAENAPEGANVGSRLSNIVDRRGQTVTYRIVPNVAGNEIGGPDGDLFDIDPRNGQITAKQPFDFESAKEYYQFGVSASNADRRERRGQRPGEGDGRGRAAGAARAVRRDQPRGAGDPLRDRSRPGRVLGARAQRHGNQGQLGAAESGPQACPGRGALPGWAPDRNLGAFRFAPRRGVLRAGLRAHHRGTSARHRLPGPRDREQRRRRRFI